MAGRIRQADVEEVKARANKGRGVRHIIWVATRPADMAKPKTTQNPKRSGFRPKS